MKILLRSTKLYLIALLVPLFIGGCAKLPTHTIRKLTHLDTSASDYEKTKNGVTIQVKTLTTKKECIDIFGKNGKYLLRSRKRKTYPIKITIDNKSDQPWYLSLNNIELKTAPIENILSRLHYWTGTRALLTCILLYPAALIVTFLGAMACATEAGARIGIPLVYSAVATLYTIPTIQGISSYRANHRITKQVKESTLHREKGRRKRKQQQEQDPQSMIIKSSQMKSTLIFVKQRDYKSNFTIALQPENKAGEKLLFDVQLPAV